MSWATRRMRRNAQDSLATPQRARLRHMKPPSTTNHRRSPPPRTGEETDVRNRRFAKHAQLLVLAFFLLPILLPACGDSNGSDSNAAPLTPELRRVLEQVAAIRQLPAPSDLRAGTVARRDAAERIEETLTEADLTAFAHLTTLYRLLGHLGPDQDYHSVYRAFIGDAVIGFYSPPDKEFFIVTDSDRIGFESLNPLERTTLAHEFTHAIQDSNFDLQATFASTGDDLDWTLALISVVEGDAVITEGLWAREFALRQTADRALLAGLSRYAPVPASIEREFRFPYTTGAEWVSIVRSQGGNEAINAILRGKRLTTAEIIHPNLYDAGFQPESVTLPDLTSALGAGWQHESGGAFGEFQLRNYLQLRLAALPAVTAASGWRGDRYDVYASGTKAVAAFGIRFASSAEAQEFVAAQDTLLKESGATATSTGEATISELADGRTTIRRSTTGPDVLFVIASDRATAEAAYKAIAGS